MSDNVVVLLKAYHHRIGANEKRMLFEPMFLPRDKIGSVLWITMRRSHLSEILAEGRPRAHLLAYGAGNNYN